MSWIIEFRPAARSEFDEAADWYESQKSGLRAEFVYAVDAALSRVLDSPQSFPIVHGSKIRRALVHKFPFAVFFEVEDIRIVVHSVFHTSRNPVIWRGRVN